ncbi:dihydrolipoyl dehydrogenase [Halomonas sediminis]
MQQRDVDIAIIGAGSAGLSAWHAANKYTDNVVIIEEGEYGTTCARVGCMPSKLLIAAAERAHQVGDAAGFGVKVDNVTIDGRAVMERVKHERDGFVDSVLTSMQRIDAAKRLEGHARFIDAHTLAVGEHSRVRARNIIIATGSRPTWPDSFEGAGDRLIVNDDIFDWDNLPESVAVFGPGIIGLELGQALHRLGVRLRMFGIGGSLGPFQDDTLRDYADQTFKAEFYLDPDAKVESIEREGDQVVVTFLERDTGQRLTERFDYLLAATGRRPNLDKLALENAGLALDDKGVPSFNRFTLQCLDASGEPSHIFIAGDADQELPLLHEAINEGRIAGANAGRYPDCRVTQRNVALAIVFTDPQIATVGSSREELEQCYGGHGCIAVGEITFKKQGRAKVIRETRGMLRLYAEHGSGQFLGAELFGPQIEHMAHLLAWALEQKLSVSRMLEMPFYHPVLEEGLRSALYDLNADLRKGPEIIEHCMECGPGD